MAGMVPVSQEDLASAAGFPLAGAVPAAAIPSKPDKLLVPGAVAPPQKNPYPAGSPAARTWMPDGTMASPVYQGRAAHESQLSPQYTDQNDRLIARTPEPVAPWIAALTSLLPGRGAVAATPSTSPSSTLSRINGAIPAGMPAAPPLAPWYERMGLVPSSKPPQVSRDGVRG